LKKERDRKNTGIKIENNSKTTLIFTHRTLKRSFSNHVLMQDLIKTGDAGFNGIYKNAQGSLRRGCHVWGGGVLLAVGHMSMRLNLKLLLLVISICNFASFILHLHLHRFDFKRPKPTTSFPGCVYTKKTKKPGLSRVCPGRPGSGSTLRVDRVLPGQLLSGFLLRPGPVSGLGRPGPGSTRRAGPGFKTSCGTT